MCWSRSAAFRFLSFKLDKTFRTEAFTSLSPESMEPWVGSVYCNDAIVKSRKKKLIMRATHVFDGIHLWDVLSKAAHKQPVLMSQGRPGSI